MLAPTSQPIPLVLPSKDLSSVKEFSPITDDRLRPLPEVQSFEYGVSTTDEIITALIKAGGVIIRHAVSEETLRQIEKDTAKYLGDFMADNEDKYNSFFSKRSKRVTGLAGKSKAYIESITQHPLFKSVRNELLTSHFPFWIGDSLENVSSPPQLHNAIIFSVRPGAPDQALHRDDTVAHNVCHRKTAEQYVQGQDTAIGWFVAGKPSTKENGATRFIPGSHLWDHMTPPDETLTVQAELDKGDAFMFLASCYHGASANRTTDQERLLYSTFFTKSTLRQEENQFLANTWEMISNMGYADETLQDIGYGLNQPISGWADFKHPLEFLRGESWDP